LIVAQHRNHRPGNTGFVFDHIYRYQRWSSCNSFHFQNVSHSLINRVRGSTSKCQETARYAGGHQPRSLRLGSDSVWHN
jgi:hypothetical protein